MKDKMKIVWIGADANRGRVMVNITWRGRTKYYNLPKGLMNSLEQLEQVEYIDEAKP